MFPERSNKIRHQGVAPYLLAAVVLCLAYCVARLIAPVPVFPLDDPYITLHSAMILHTGRVDPNYPGVSPLQGITSAPFLGLVYLLLFFLPPIYSIDAACWLGTLAYVFGLLYMTRSFKLTPLQSRLLIGLGLICSYVPFQLLNGLETSWALACVTWTIGLAAQRRVLWASAMAGLGASIRPDLSLLAIVLVVFFAVQEYQATQSLRKAAWCGVLCTAIAAAMVLPWVVWYHHATGFALPQTGVAKRYFFADDRQPLSAKVRAETVGLLQFALTAGFLFLAVVRLWRSPLGRALLLFLGLFLASIFVQFPNALQWNWFRYPVIIVPFLIWALGSYLNDTARSEIAQRWLCACCIYSVLFFPVVASAYAMQIHSYDQGSKAMAAWCRHNLPSDARLLVHDAGYIAYATSFRVTDMVGLKTPEAIAQNRQYTWPSAGRARSRAVSNLARSTKSDTLILIADWNPTRHLPAELILLGWKVNLIYSEGQYRIYHLSAP